MNKLSGERILRRVGEQSNTYISVGLQLISALCGFLATKAQVLDGMHPFGLSIVAGVDMTYFLSAAAGSLISCLSFPAGSLFRHISALFAVVSIRYLLQQYNGKPSRPMLSAISCLAVTVITGAVAASVSFAESLPVFAEGILAGGGAYFTAKTKDILPLRLKRPGENEAVSTVVVLNILLMGLYSVELWGISPGRIIAAALILAAALYGKIPAGAVAGTAAGLSLVLTGGSAAEALALAVAGVLTGVFSSISRLAMAAILILSCAMLALTEGFSDNTLFLLMETVAGSAVFLILPKRICTMLSAVFSPTAHTPTLEGMRHSLLTRIRDAAQAIFDVSSTVDEVSGRLKQINSPSFEQAITRVENDACVGCCLRLQCWESNRLNTFKALTYACTEIKKGRFSASTLNDDCEMGCLRPDKVSAALQKHYNDYAQRLSAEERLTEVRSVVSDQFGGISDMLYELSQEFGSVQEFDTKTAEKITDALCETGVTVSECGCSIDKDGRFNFELKIPKVSENINRADIVECISSVCGRPFGAPNVRRTSEYLLLTVGEKPILTAEMGVCQQPEGGPTQLCGDSADYFFDGKGKLYMILSDGMGSGGRAAVDGALLSGLLTRMISAGFSMDSSLKISNSAMLFRSSDESLVTADVTCLDLFSGTVDMYKAGAAPTLVRKSGRTGKAESRSLPAGILQDISFDHASIDLKAGDIILMMSDGATADGTDWICAELEAWGDGSAAQLANKIATGAERRRSDGHSDDITVMAAIIQSA